MSQQQPIQSQTNILLSSNSNNSNNSNINVNKNKQPKLYLQFKEGIQSFTKLPLVDIQLDIPQTPFPYEDYEDSSDDYYDDN